jgi:hypothetical protein
MIASYLAEAFPRDNVGKSFLGLIAACVVLVLLHWALPLKSDLLVQQDLLSKGSQARRSANCARGPIFCKAFMAVGRLGHYEQPPRSI